MESDHQHERADATAFNEGSHETSDDEESDDCRCRAHTHRQRAGAAAARGAMRQHHAGNRARNDEPGDDREDGAHRPLRA